MKKNKIVLVLTFLLVLTNLKKNHAQNTLEVAVDTFQIVEASVVDSAIITILDSALTFVRVPPLEYGTYYYSLIITKPWNRDNNDSVVDFYNIYKYISLYVTDHLVINNSALEDFKKDEKMLFNYKGIPIVIWDNDSIANRYFKPLNNQSNYYYYHKVDKKNPAVIIVPEKIYSQTVEFTIFRSHIRFNSYKILHTLWSESGSMILEFPD